MPLHTWSWYACEINKLKQVTVKERGWWDDHAHANNTGEEESFSLCLESPDTHSTSSTEQGARTAQEDNRTITKRSYLFCVNMCDNDSPSSCFQFEADSELYINAFWPVSALWQTHTETIIYRNMHIFISYKIPVHTFSFNVSRLVTLYITFDFYHYY